MARIAFFSDTHNKHGLNSIGTYKAFEGVDIAVFCGDMSGRGYKTEIENFLYWYSRMPVNHRILIGGNHDFLLEKISTDEVQKMLAAANDGSSSNITYLNDSEATIDGIRFYGSPITPWFHAWAFNRLPGDDIAKHWDMIPDDGIDVLITHGPPQGILDKVDNDYQRNKNVGCPQLRQQIFERVKPKYHAFGHIHEAYGMVVEDGITFINASILDADYQSVNDPIIVDFVK